MPPGTTASLPGPPPCGCGPLTVVYERTCVSRPGGEPPACEVTRTVEVGAGGAAAGVSGVSVSDGEAASRVEPFDMWTASGGDLR